MFSTIRRLLALGILAILFVAVIPFQATIAHAVTLPAHCSDLLDGDCDRPLLCLAMCFMELAGLYEFCDRYPNDPRCM